MAAFRWLLVDELEVKSPRITCSLIPLVTTIGSWNKQNCQHLGKGVELRPPPSRGFWHL